MIESKVHPLRHALGPLLPCPFCGAAATVEADPWRGESIRVACAGAACPVSPKTEYLLTAFAGELRAAWNGRANACAAESQERKERTSHRVAEGHYKNNEGGFSVPL